MVIDTRFYSWRASNGLIYAGKIVVHEMYRDGVAMVREFF
jgi:hypothetical protein